MHLWQHGYAEVLGSLGVMGHDINASENCLGVVLQQMKDTFAGLGKGKEAGEQKVCFKFKDWDLHPITFESHYMTATEQR